MKNYIRYSSQTGLTDSDIIDIRINASSMTTAEIAEEYNIDKTTAARIISGRTWSHVPLPRGIGNYIIYPDGRVFSKASRRFMTVSYGKDGAAYVELRSGGKRNKTAVASLVASAFIGRTPKKIRFLNGRPEDSHFSNLAAG